MSDTFVNHGYNDDMVVLGVFARLGNFCLITRMIMAMLKLAILCKQVDKRHRPILRKRTNQICPIHMIQTESTF